MRASNRSLCTLRVTSASCSWWPRAWVSSHSSDQAALVWKTNRMSAIGPESHSTLGSSCQPLSFPGCIQDWPRAPLWNPFPASGPAWSLSSFTMNSVHHRCHAQPLISKLCAPSSLLCIPVTNVNQLINIQGQELHLLSIPQCAQPTLTELLRLPPGQAPCQGSWTSQAWPQSPQAGIGGGGGPMPARWQLDRLYTAPSPSPGSQEFGKVSLGVRAGVPDLHTQTCLPSQSAVTRRWLSLPGASALSRILAGRQS